MTAVTTRFWWIRHAPVINPERILYGQSDIAADLSDDDAFAALAEKLPDDAVWVTTTLARARQTAEKIAKYNSTEIDINLRDTLREQYFGDWEGQSWDTIPQEEQAPYWADAVNNHPPNGESFFDITNRVADTVNTLLETHNGGDIVIVAHAGSIRAAIAMATQSGPRAGLSFHVAPLSLTRIDAIERDDDVWWRIESVNKAPNDA
ncbi:MAG: histidine phosphatase family protein [Alphaproteobacteria bacterium]|nr:histidine phosphatase family protein [Alphaproteobacteria bacterium]